MAKKSLIQEVRTEEQKSITGNKWKFNFWGRQPKYPRLVIEWEMVKAKTDITSKAKWLDMNQR